MLFIEFIAISSTEVGVNTSLDIGTQKDEPTKVTMTSVGVNTLMYFPTAEMGINTAGVQVEEPHSPEVKRIKVVEDKDAEFTTPCQKIELQNEIESIEGFKLEAKSVSKIKSEDISTPEKNLHTPKKPGTSKFKNMSPYSPGWKTLQQTVKQLEKLLEESKKEVDKKASVLVTRNNRINQLEAQVNNLEKKNNIKKIVEEKSCLEEQITSLTQQVNVARDTLNEKNDLLCTMKKELQVWTDKSESYQSKLKKADSDLLELQNNVNKKQQEMQELLDAHLSNISLLTNGKIELMKEIEPMKVCVFCILIFYFCFVFVSVRDQEF